MAVEVSGQLRAVGSLHLLLREARQTDPWQAQTRVKGPVINKKDVQFVTSSPS